MPSRKIHFEKCKRYNKVKDYILRLQLQQKTTFVSIASLDSDSFHEKLQDPWALLLPPSFSYKRNCWTLGRCNLALLFFDK